MRFRFGRNYRQRQQNNSIPLRQLVAGLFRNGEQGAWYDPSDLTTLFQDEAGTTPVTAVEQPVSRMLDKSGRGNHATTPAAASASRPTLSARVNLLTYSEQFDNAVWTKSEASISSNAITAPDGTLTADKLIESTANNQHRVFFTIITAPNTYTFTVYVKAAERTFARITHLSVSPQPAITVNLQTGALTNAVNVTSSSSENVGNGWWRVSITYTTTTSVTSYPQVGIFNTQTNGTYTGDGTSGIYIWGADLRTTNIGVGLPVYQRIAAATDYDTVGFPHYLRFDGSDDYMLTGSINFSATDKMTVFAGVRNLSNIATGMLVELSSSITTNNGTFDFQIPTSGNIYRIRSKGTVISEATTANVFVPPRTDVLTGIGNITGDSVIMRSNTNLVASSATDQGSGNYGNYPLYIGRRGGSSLPFNGRLYSLIVRGAQSTAAEITNTERYVNSKTKAY